MKIFGQGAPGVSARGRRSRASSRSPSGCCRRDFSFDWGGASYQEKKSSGTSGLALGLAVLMVFLILSAQYEKWSLPLSVLLALPFGTFGALRAVWLRGLTNDVYFQIGLVTLLGPGGEERDPDRRIRRAEAPRGHVAPRRRRWRRRGCASGRS